MAQNLQSAPPPATTDAPPPCRYLQVGAEVAGDVRTITLAEHSDLLLDVLDLILCLFQVNDFDGHHLLGVVVDALVHLPKRALANAVKLGEEFLWVHTRVLLKPTGTEC